MPLLAAERLQLLGAREVPELDRLVGARGEKLLAVRANGDAIDRLRVALIDKRDFLWPGRVLGRQEQPTEGEHRETNGGTANGGDHGTHPREAWRTGKGIGAVRLVSLPTATASTGRLSLGVDFGAKANVRCRVFAQWFGSKPVAFRARFVLPIA